MENVLGLGHVGIIAGRVPNPEGRTVFRIKVVLAGHHLSESLLKGLVLLFCIEVLGFHQQLVYFVALAVYGLKGGEGCVEIVAAHHAVIFVDADHRKADAIDAHLLVDGSLAVLEEVIAVLVADDNDLALFGKVYLVDEASFQ